VIVHVYRNLRHRDRRAWSIVASEGPLRGRVIEVVSAAVVEDATFVVRSGGRARVLREKQKNVHAFVKGNLIKRLPLDAEPDASSVESLAPGFDEFFKVSYDPYVASRFFSVSTGETIEAATMVVATSDGVYAKERR